MNGKFSKERFESIMLSTNTSYEVLNKKTGHDMEHLINKYPDPMKNSILHSLDAMNCNRKDVVDYIYNVSNDLNFDELKSIPFTNYGDKVPNGLDDDMINMLMEEKNLTKTTMSLLLGKSENYYWIVRDRFKTIPVDIISNICIILECDVDDIYSYDHVRICKNSKFKYNKNQIYYLNKESEYYHLFTENLYKELNLPNGILDNLLISYRLMNKITHILNKVNGINLKNSDLFLIDSKDRSLKSLLTLYNGTIFNIDDLNKFKNELFNISKNKNFGIKINSSKDITKISNALETYGYSINTENGKYVLEPITKNKSNKNIKDKKENKEKKEEMKLKSFEELKKFMSKNKQKEEVISEEPEELVESEEIADKEYLKDSVEAISEVIDPEEIISEEPEDAMESEEITEEVISEEPEEVTTESAEEDIACIKNINEFCDSINKIYDVTILENCLKLTTYLIRQLDELNKLKYIGEDMGLYININTDNLIEIGCIKCDRTLADMFIYIMNAYKNYDGNIDKLFILIDLRIKQLNTLDK